MTKAPREFWMNKTEGIDFNNRNWSSNIYVHSDGPSPYHKSIHVIEYSAYEKAVAQVKLLKEALEYTYEACCKHSEIRGGFNGRHWCSDCNSWIYEEDNRQLEKAREALKQLNDSEGEK